jgi:hypothetical protein
MSFRTLLPRPNPPGGVRSVPVREFLVARAFVGGVLPRTGVQRTIELNRMDSVLPGLVEQASRLRTQPLRFLAGAKV